MTTNTYNDSNIKILEGLEAVRKRPGMYIGSTDAHGLHHLVYEIVDNAVDEALAGFGKEIDVTIEKNGSVTVRDFGRGIPTGMHKTGRPTIEVIFTILHAGGKFDDSSYKTSGGLHGVGSSVVNALSKSMTVKVNRDGLAFKEEFKDGGKPVGTLQKLGKTKEPDGTTVNFLPDDTIFSEVDFNFDVLKERIKEAAYLLKNVRFVLKDKRTGRKEEYIFPDGIKTFVADLSKDKELIGQIFDFSGKEQGVEVEFAGAFNTGYSEVMYSFVNNVRTPDGGTHEVGVRSGLTRAFNEYFRSSELLKEKEKNIDGSDLREGLTGVLSVRVPEELLQFEGQTKEKLGSPVVKGITENIIYEQTKYYLLESGDFGQKIFAKAKAAQEARIAARKARDTVRKGKKSKKNDGLISGKLTPAQKHDAKHNELFLVEGDSAGGSAKQGRNRKFQAILPLRGKVLNTQKASLEEIFKNQEINTIIYAIGAGAGKDFKVKDSNYDKVIIMTDADTDGAHIQILLLTFFYRYMLDLVIAGKVYIAMPPLYKIQVGIKKPKIEYAWTEDELESKTKQIKTKYALQRFKGLGEMNADELWETTMNPDTRTLLRVKIEDLAFAGQEVETLMGDQVSPRRKWIESNVDFSDHDENDNILEVSR
ncbi:DNA topoisomerase 4 subunit B [Xylocopilactobacillus apicola]|uniref:DNA topoisomerase (ATP-hydrolyzing) n=2 Tax=Xylocopilactobacillus apicola TaxID=2932184 RepID=A0AAU9DIY3_9LACO|nr:DNA topoisomerase IV subunit B [Xylocopilactobacillus apicola]BDR58411.1 DNA topoisomerase 4 subunit B [Xylocopilactobacillus apicola]